MGELSIESVDFDRWDVAGCTAKGPSDQYCAAAITGVILSALQSLSQERVVNAAEYIILKIEDLQLAEKLSLAARKNDLDALGKLLIKVRERPESLFLLEMIGEVFDDALSEERDGVAELIWTGAGDRLYLSEYDATSVMESFIERGNEEMAYEILDRFPLDVDDIDEVINAAIDEGMFPLLDDVFEKYKDRIGSYAWESIFKHAAKGSSEDHLRIARVVWPQAKSNIDAYSLQSMIQDASGHMKGFLESCLKEKRS